MKKSSTFSLASVESARRRLVSVSPAETSLVDVPAIEEEFVILKDKTGGGKTEGDEGKVDVAALVKGLGDQMTSAIGDLKTTFADLAKKGNPFAAKDDDEDEDEKKKKAAVKKAAEDAAAAGGSVDAATIASEVTKNVIDQLQTAGIIQKPDTPAEAIAKSLDTFQAKVTEGFSTITKAVEGIDARVQKMEGDDGDGSGQTEEERAAALAAAELKKSKGGKGGKDEELTDESPILSHMLAAGLKSHRDMSAN